MTPTRRHLLSWLGGVLAGFAATARVSAEAAPPEPAGFRSDDYQAPTPATLDGRPALTTAQAKDLWTGQGAVFIDVLPHVPRPAGVPAETIWQDKPHRSIEGAVWLPEVGRGSLAPETEAYFTRSLAELAGQSRARPLVFFCKRHCWMSWNAAKRARSYGYSRVLWYADGVEGWTEAALPLAVVQPRP